MRRKKNKQTYKHNTEKNLTISCRIKEEKWKEWRNNYRNNIINSNKWVVLRAYTYEHSRNQAFTALTTKQDSFVEYRKD